MPDNEMMILNRDIETNINRFKNTRESILCDTNNVRAYFKLSADYKIVLPGDSLEAHVLAQLSETNSDVTIEYRDIPKYMEYGRNVDVQRKRAKNSVQQTYVSDIRMNGGVCNITYKGANFYGFISYHCIDRVEYTYEIWLVHNNEVEAFNQFMVEYLKFNRALNTTHKRVHVYGGADYSVNNLAYNWDDVVLDKKVKASISESVDFWFKNEQWYRDKKFPYKRGVLIHGYPGNGKTFITKIIISQYDLNIVQFNFGNPNITNSDLTEAFREAREDAPTLFLLEDVDRVFSDFERNSTRITKDCLFNCLDGIEELDGVLVIATANHVEDLDSAFINRPSRFDTIIRLDNPTPELRLEYLKKLFEKDYNNNEVLSDVACQCDAMSMAFMKEIYFKSIINSLDNSSKVTDANIYDALDECLKHFSIARTAKSENETGFKTQKKKAGFGQNNGTDAPAYAKVPAQVSKPIL